MATSATMRRLLALVHEYAAEPAPVDSDAATERDLECFDRILVLLGQHDSGIAAGQPVPAIQAEYRVRWEIDLTANGPVDAARQARAVQLRADSLATVFDVLRRADTAEERDWSLAETIDLTAHVRSDDLALDEIARVLRAAEPHAADDLAYIAELVQLTGRDIAAPTTPQEQIDWR
jgi:hypothetical protein